MSVSPASSIAWPAASMPIDDERIDLALDLVIDALVGIEAPGMILGFTSQAMRHFWSLASKRVIGPAPDLPAIRLLQVVSTSQPRGVTRPRPVTTTRRMRISENATGSTR
jgi:hypothetical protein